VREKGEKEEREKGERQQRVRNVRGGKKTTDELQRMLRKTKATLARKGEQVWGDYNLVGGGGKAMNTKKTYR